MSKNLAFIILISLSAGLFNNAEGQIITTVAGNGTVGASGDGGFATAAKFDSLAYVTIDTSWNLFVSDQWNH
jgi:hypothetical protein